jgi:hypothetical protein
MDPAGAGIESGLNRRLPYIRRRTVLHRWIVHASSARLGDKALMPMIGRTFERCGLLLVPTDPTNPNPEWFNHLHVERKKEVMAGGLGVRLLEEGLPYVVPIFWLGVGEEAGGKLTNGSAFLVDCGQGVFAVTAAHVYAAYCKAKLRTAQFRPCLRATICWGS